MADSLFTIDVDTAPAVEAFARLIAETERRCFDACKVTAQSAVREMRLRLERQLGPEATGRTVASIGTEPARDGDGWIVFVERDLFPNLPLWLEKGTKPGRRRNYARTAPRPFFYSSLTLEIGPHERRIREAMADSAGAVGLGE